MISLNSVQSVDVYEEIQSLPTWTSYTRRSDGPRLS